jgi:uncharacterized protein YukJ
MTLKYGYVKCKIVSEPVLQSSRRRSETQYHLHARLHVATGRDGRGTETWDSAINVGTNDADDLLNYRLAFDFHHPIVETLKAAPPGYHDLTGTHKLPALDFLRSDILAETGRWRESDVMDGSASPEPVATLKRLLHTAHQSGADVYIFGRTYTSGGSGIHDVHMNQGSSGSFLNNGTDHNDHNDVWQDGAVLVDLGESGWAGYFTAFTQQNVPTDDRGNPAHGNHPLGNADVGSLAGSSGGGS